MANLLLNKKNTNIPIPSIEKVHFYTQHSLKYLKLESGAPDYAENESIVSILGNLSYLSQRHLDWFALCRNVLQYITMPKSKRLSTTFRTKGIDAYKSGKGFKKIDSQLFDIQSPVWKISNN